MFGKAETVSIRALYIGEHIDLRQLEKVRVFARNPLVLQLDEAAYAVIFRFGAVVLFNVGPSEESALMRELLLLTREPLPMPLSEELRLSIQANGRDDLQKGGLIVTGPGVEKIQVIASVLAKSVVLEFYENEEKRNFDTLTPFGEFLRGVSHRTVKPRDLLRHIGQVLLHQQNMIGRVELTEKPDVLWNFPELEGFYQLLQDEYEITERDTALARKHELISRTANTVLDVINAKRSLRVEWYIVILIVFEIILTLYEMFVR